MSVKKVVESSPLREMAHLDTHLVSPDGKELRGFDLELDLNLSPKQKKFGRKVYRVYGSKSEIVRWLKHRGEVNMADDLAYADYIDDIQGDNRKARDFFVESGQREDPKKWKDDRVLTYKEAQRLAMAYYNQGGDGFYECWDEKEFNDFLEIEGGQMTVGRMKSLFNIYDEVDRDMRGSGQYQEESFQSPVDAAEYYYSTPMDDREIENDLKSTGHDDKFVKDVLRHMDEIFDEEERNNTMSRRFNESESDEEVTVGIYGDEVPKFSSFDEIVSYFDKKGIKVLEKSGDTDTGWDLTLRGKPRQLFFAIVNVIPGYRSDSVQEFIDQYRIDESLKEGYVRVRYKDEEFGHKQFSLVRTSLEAMKKALDKYAVDKDDIISVEGCEIDDLFESLTESSNLSGPEREALIKERDMLYKRQSEMDAEILEKGFEACMHLKDEWHGTSRRIGEINMMLNPWKLIGPIESLDESDEIESSGAKEFVVTLTVKMEKYDNDEPAEFDFNADTNDTGEIVLTPVDLNTHFVSVQVQKSEGLRESLEEGTESRSYEDHSKLQSLLMSYEKSRKFAKVSPDPKGRGFLVTIYCSKNRNYEKDQRNSTEREKTFIKFCDEEGLDYDYVGSPYVAEQFLVKGWKDDEQKSDSEEGQLTVPGV